MNPRWIVGALVGLMVAGGGMSYYLTRTPGHGHIPPEVLDRMKFDHGTADMVGDTASGRMCHEVRLRNSEGETVIGRGYIDRKDFRTLTDAEKRAAIIQSAKGIVEASGVSAACLPDPDGWFPGVASVAFADPPKCLDCDGGCGSASCPAHVPLAGPPCQMTGPDCIISIICCSSSCNCW